MIKEIRLINWKSHEDTIIKFGKGTNLIVGIMGSGKSSIMDGISFGLFGTFPQLESRRVVISDLFRYDSQELIIELEIEWENESYKIIRKVSKNEKRHVSDALLYKNLKLVEKGNKSVTQYVEGLLKIDYGLFTRAIYSEQNNIDYFLSVNPKKRKEEFDSLLDLDKFDRAVSNLTTIINRIRNKRKSFESVFDETKLESLKKERNISNEKIIDIRKQLEEIKTKIKETKNEFEKKNNEFVGYKKIEKMDKELNESKKEIKIRLEEYQKRVIGKIIDEEDVQIKKHEINGLEEEIKKINENILKLDEIKNVKNRELIVYNEKKRRKEYLESEIKKLRKEDLDKVKVDKKRLEEELANLMGFLLGSEREKNEINDALQKLGNRINECPVCSSVLDEQKKERIINEKKSKLEKIEEEMRNVKKKIEEIKKELESKIREISSIEKIEIRKSQMEKELLEYENIPKDFGSLEKEIEEYDERKRKLSMDREEKSELRNKLKYIILEIEEIVSINKKILENKKNFDEILEKIKKLEFDEGKMKNIEKEIQSITISIEKNYGEMKLFEKEEEYLTRILQNVDREIKQKTEIKTKIMNQMEKEENLLLFKKILEDVQISLRDQLIESINNAMNEIWLMFYPYGDYKKLRIRVNENDYLFEVYKNDWKTMESIVSGGERACASLTLRVALATVLTPGLSWLILDEPTHNLDREAIELMSETLQTKVPEIISQAIVITHEEALLGANFSRSYRLSRNKEKYEPTQIEVL
ncbi:MAG: AAA family ATPase [Candidatus ainarchaeum sp.]|nr:AAA family ATPase [Candidatus ainarchaeum sp.]